MSAEPDWSLETHDDPAVAVRFFADDRALARIVAGFLAEGLAAGSPAIVVASPPRRAAIARELTRRSFDVAALQRSEDLLLLDAEETMATFMIDGKPDAQKYSATMFHLIRRACRDRADCGVRVFTHMIDVLWNNGRRDAAIRLEVLWNEFVQTGAFSLHCAYVVGHFYKELRTKPGDAGSPR